jgi:hypothetical protein
VAAPAYDVTLDLGSPEPSPHAAPRVRVWVEDGAAAEWMIGRGVASYTLRTAAPADGVLRIGLRAPTWNRTGQPAEQGVRLDRVRVTPVAGAR